MVFFTVAKKIYWLMRFWKGQRIDLICADFLRETTLELYHTAAKGNWLLDM